MDREQTIRARARMGLRAEQAFGLRSLPLRIVEQKDVLENETPATSKSEPARVGPVACDPVDLFGKPLTKQPVQVPVPALDAFAAPGHRPVVHLVTHSDPPLDRRPLTLLRHASPVRRCAAGDCGA